MKVLVLFILKNLLKYLLLVSACSASVLRRVKAYLNSFINSFKYVTNAIIC